MQLFLSARDKQVTNALLRQGMDWDYNACNRSERWFQVWDADDEGYDREEVIRKGHEIDCCSPVGGSLKGDYREYYNYIRDYRFTAEEIFSMYHWLVERDLCEEDETPLSDLTGSSAQVSGNNFLFFILLHRVYFKTYVRGRIGRLRSMVCYDEEDSRAFPIYGRRELSLNFEAIREIVPSHLPAMDSSEIDHDCIRSMYQALETAVVVVMSLHEELFPMKESAGFFPESGLAKVEVAHGDCTESLVQEWLRYIVAEPYTSDKKRDIFFDSVRTMIDHTSRLEQYNNLLRNQLGRDTDLGVTDALRLEGLRRYGMVRGTDYGVMLSALVTMRNIAEKINNDDMFPWRIVIHQDHTYTAVSRRPLIINTRTFEEHHETGDRPTNIWFGYAMIDFNAFRHNTPRFGGLPFFKRSSDLSDEEYKLHPHIESKYRFDGDGVPFVGVLGEESAICYGNQADKIKKGLCLEDDLWLNSRRFGDLEYSRLDKCFDRLNKLYLEGGDIDSSDYDEFLSLVRISSPTRWLRALWETLSEGVAGNDSYWNMTNYAIARSIREELKGEEVNGGVTIVRGPTGKMKDILTIGGEELHCIRQVGISRSCARVEERDLGMTDVYKDVFRNYDIDSYMVTLKKALELESFEEAEETRNIIIDYLMEDTNFTRTMTNVEMKFLSKHYDIKTMYLEKDYQKELQTLVPGFVSCRSDDQIRDEITCDWTEYDEDGYVCSQTKEYREHWCSDRLRDRREIDEEDEDDDEEDATDPWEREDEELEEDIQVVDGPEEGVPEEATSVSLEEIARRIHIPEGTPPPPRPPLPTMPDNIMIGGIGSDNSERSLGDIRGDNNESS